MQGKTLSNLAIGSSSQSQSRPMAPRTDTPPLSDDEDMRRKLVHPKTRALKRQTHQALILNPKPVNSLPLWQSHSPQKPNAVVCLTPDADPEDFSRRLKISFVSFSKALPIHQGQKALQSRCWWGEQLTQNLYRNSLNKVLALLHLQQVIEVREVILPIIYSIVERMIQFGFPSWPDLSYPHLVSPLLLWSLPQAMYLLLVLCCFHFFICFCMHLSHDNIDNQCCSLISHCRTFPQFFISSNPSIETKRVNLTLASGFVKMSATLSPDGKCFILTFSSSTASLIKWYRRSMCLVRKWNLLPFERAMADWLSDRIVSGPFCFPLILL